MVNLGTPENTNYTSMWLYLREFLSDKRIIELTRLIWFPILYFIILILRPRKSGKLYEKISPNKTVEGFFAGLITGSLVMYIVLTNNFEIETIPTLLISLIFILFGVLGDLFESRIKRSLDVKDSSDFLPGHGGVLDRVDSQILSFPVLVLFIQFLDLI